MILLVLTLKLNNMAEITLANNSIINISSTKGYNDSDSYVITSETLNPGFDDQKTVFSISGRTPHNTPTTIGTLQLV